MKSRKFLYSFIVCHTVQVVVRAGGFEGPGIGTKALSMGGAFVGLADDWSAGFWNPAGLAFQKGWGIGQSVDFISLRSFDGNGMANPTPPYTRSNIEQGDVFTQLGGEPSHFGVTDTTLQAALPSLAAYKVWTSWAMSAGVYSPLGFAFNIDDTSVPGIHAAFNSKGYITDYNFSIAHQWNDRWSLGAGVNLLDAQLKREASKQTSTYTFNSDSDGRGQAVQGVFGFLGRLHRKVSMGAVYKTGTRIKLGGTATVSDSRFPLTVPGLGILQNEASPVTNTIYNPAEYLAGFAYYPTASCTLTMDWQGTDWSPYRTDVQFSRPGPILQSQDFNAGWRFTHRARAGGEYRWSPRPKHEAALRWGYTWDPSAVPDSAVSETNLVDVSRHFLSVGISLKTGAFEPAIAFSYAAGSRTANGIEYKKVDRLLSIGLQYKIQ